MATHTPGPWRVIKALQKEYRCVAFSMSPDEPYTTSPILPADARLIAAAPDLLAALKGLLTVYVECIQPNCPFSEAATSEFAARSAITKAEGGAK